LEEVNNLILDIEYMFMQQTWPFNLLSASIQDNILLAY